MQSNLTHARETGSFKHLSVNSMECLSNNKIRLWTGAGVVMETLSVTGLFKSLSTKLFLVLSRWWGKGKFWVPMRKLTSDFRVPRSGVLPMSHRDSVVSKALYVFYLWHTVCILLGSAMSIASCFNNGDSEFFLCLTLVTRRKTLMIVLYFLTELKTYHLSSSIYKSRWLFAGS